MKSVSVHRLRMRWQGTYLRRNGSLGINASGAQCVNVDNQLADKMGIAASPGNAIALTYPGSVWVENRPDNFPPAGALVKFFAEFPYDPEAGHTGMALHNCTVDELHILWQNDPEGAPCEVVWTDYTACMGWWILRSETAKLVY